MVIKSIEKPKIGLKNALTVLFAIISILIGAIAFILGREKLTIWLSIAIIAIVIFLPFFIQFMWYIVKYLKYILVKSNNYERLLELYGKKEEEVDERDKTIGSFKEQYLHAHTWGYIKGYAVMKNALSSRLSKLRSKDIKILEKSAGPNGAILVFNVGKSDGMEKDMLLSIVTEYSNELWGVIIITSVGQATSKGEPIVKINRVFWSKIEEEMSHNPSAPPGVKARLYESKDFETEAKLFSEVDRDSSNI